MILGLCRSFKVLGFCGVRSFMVFVLFDVVNVLELFRVLVFLFLVYLGF